MAKPKDNITKNSSVATKKPEMINGAPVRKSGSAIASMPKKEYVNTMKFDYSSLEYKQYPNRVKVNIELNEERFPAESKVPPYDKYDEKGNYIKNKFIATEKKVKKVEGVKYSIGQLVREHALSNPHKNNGRKR